MQIINKKNYIPIVCVIYTLLSLNKAFMEGISGDMDKDYVRNFVFMFVMVALSVFVLSLHYYLQNIPIVLVIITQYLLLLVLIMGYVWIDGHFSPLAKHAYRDIFLSFTIPYILLVPVYYIQFFMQIRKANRILPELMEENAEDGKEK